MARQIAKRSIWIWVVVIYIAQRTVRSLDYIANYVFSPDELSAQLLLWLDSLPVLFWVSAALLMMANVLGAVYLLRLRIAAFYLLVASLVGDIATYLWYMVFTDYIETINALYKGAAIQAYIDILANCLIVCYCWQLKNKQVLTHKRAV